MISTKYLATFSILVVLVQYSAANFFSWKKEPTQPSTELPTELYAPISVVNDSDAFDFGIFNSSNVPAHKETATIKILDGPSQSSGSPSEPGVSSSTDSIGTSPTTTNASSVENRSVVDKDEFFDEKKKDSNFEIFKDETTTATTTTTTTTTTQVSSSDHTITTEKATQEPVTMEENVKQTSTASSRMSVDRFSRGSSASLTTESSPVASNGLSCAPTVLLFFVSGLMNYVAYSSISKVIYK